MASGFNFNPLILSQVDQVRLRLMDTGPAYVLADATISAILAIFPYDEACAQLAESLGIYYAQQAEQVMEGRLKIIYQNRFQSYAALAKTIRDVALPLPTDPVDTGSVFGVMATPDLSSYL